MSKMNLVSKLFQKSVIQKISNTDWSKGTDSPFVVELDPTTVCDLACPGCISGDLINTKNPELRGFNNDRIIELVNEMVESGVKAVVLIGGGEPLAHPSTPQIIKIMSENNVQIGLTTNGTLMKRHIDLIADHVSWTRVSVDAGTDEMFLRLRPTKNHKSKFNIVLDNMRELGKKKKGIMGYSFLIRTKADGQTENPPGKEFGLVDVSNVREIYTAAKVAKEVGCDYFEIKPSYDDDHNIVIHSEEDMELAKDQINKCNSLENENFKILGSVMLDSSLNREKPGDQIKKYTNCKSAELRTLVSPSGVYVCPYYRGQERMKIGDARYENFSEMWKKRKEVLQRLDPSKDCKNLHCIRHETNLEVDKVIEKLKKKENIDVKADDDLFI